MVVFEFILSGPNDHVFVYFTDHGGPGILAFPSGEVSLSDNPTLIHLCHGDFVGILILNHYKSTAAITNNRYLKQWLLLISIINTVSG